MTRRLGEAKARRLLRLHEEIGTWWHGQADPSRQMDEHNNEIGIRIGKDARTFDEVIEGARRAIDHGAREGGSGRDGTAVWLSRDQWHDPNLRNNWPPNWTRVEPATKPYNYGGEEYWHGRTFPPMLDVPLDALTWEDIRALSESPAANDRGHPDHDRVVDRMIEWHRRQSGGPVHVRAHEREGGRVHVDAHDRSAPGR